MINPVADLSYTEFSGSIEEFLIHTLLHEQLHCFIAQASCKRTCRKQIYLNPSLGGPGKDGHGPVWADGVIILTDALKKVVPWPVFNLLGESITQSMVYESWQPKIEQLKRWGVGLTVEKVLHWSDIDEWDRNRTEILKLDELENFSDIGLGDTLFSRIIRSRSALAKSSRRSTP